MIIILNSIKQSYDTYIIDFDTKAIEVVVSYYLDICFTIIFAIEFFIKSISLGFILDKGSYMRESWNQLDFIIIVLSVVDLSLNDLELPGVKVIRLLRAFRPLRFISRNKSMRIVVMALIQSTVAILNVAIVLLVVWLIFAILGVSLFSGQFYECSQSLIENEEDCLRYGYDWVNSYANFDNVLEATMTLFIVSSLEGWPDIMFKAIDSTEPGQAPQYNHNPYNAIFFICFILIGSFFFLNLFVGVVFEQFDLMSKHESSKASLILTQEQYLWVQLMKRIQNSDISTTKDKKPSNWLRSIFYQVSHSQTFDAMIIICIILNTIQMAVIYDGASEEYQNALEIINIFFTSIFIVECAVKLIGMGTDYFRHSWNKFDFIVVITSILDILLIMIGNFSLSIIRTGPQLARTIRVLRISKLFRLVKQFEAIQNQVRTLFYSIPAVLNVLSLLFLIYFIYSILGVQLFHHIESNQTLDNKRNFDNFGQAIILLFQLSTGEGWNLVMEECGNKTSKFISSIYFGTFITITTFVMLNLFIMVIIQQYDDIQNNPHNVRKIFKQDTEYFNKTWKGFTSNTFEHKIDYKLLLQFMKELGQFIGISKYTSETYVLKILAVLDFDIDSQGYVHYYDLLFALLKRKYLRVRIRSEAQKIMIEAKELKAKQKLRQRRASRFARVIGVHTRINPSEVFFQMVNLRGMFNGWKRLIQQRKGRKGSHSIPMSDKITLRY